MFLQWFDPDPKTPLLQKLIAGTERYIEKNGTPPTLCLLSQKDFDALVAVWTEAKADDVPDLPMRFESARHVQPNVFMIGEEGDGVPHRRDGS